MKKHHKSQQNPQIQRKQDLQQDTPLPEIKEDSTSSLKIGRFSLSTKNFWLVLVCILCMFLLAVIWTDIYSYNKMVTKFFEHQQKIIQMILKTRSQPSGT